MEYESVGIESAPLTEEEKMLPQSEVNKLIGTAKSHAEERGRAKAEAEYQQRLSELQAQKQAAMARGEDTRDIDVDALYQQVHERFNREMQERQLQMHMKEVADAFTSKMQGQKNYSDFDEVTQGFNAAEFPQIVYLIANMDNAQDIVYELAKNPQKLAYIDYLAQRSPKTAQTELRKMSSSITSNLAALAEEQQAKTNAPLDRMSPSLKTGSSGQLSVSDLRKQPWLRG